MIRIFQYVFNNLSLTNLRNCAHNTYKMLSSSSEAQNAGIIIIGDEILKAQVKDSNSHFMCSLLYECGVKVEKISVISDDIDKISNEIKDFSGKYKYVITSGGVGPTHDDMTFEGLAKAFNDSLHYNPKLVEIVKELGQSKDENSPLLKIAHIPSKAVLRFGKNEKTNEFLKFPCINLQNVYVFPGSPIYLEPLFYSLCKELFDAHRKFLKDVLYINVTEELFANALTSVAKEFPHVTFGSYPVSNQRYYKVRVTIESDNQQNIDQAIQKFCKLIPDNILVDYDNSPEINSLDKYQRIIRNLEQTSDTSLFKKSFEDLCDIYENSGKVALLIDGSIEAMVLLHLAHVARQKLKDDSPFFAIFFKTKNLTLEGRESFIKDISNRYNLKLITLDEQILGDKENLKILFSQFNTVVIPTTATTTTTTTNLVSQKQDESHSELINKLELLSIQVKCILKTWNSDSLWIFAKSFSLPYF